MILFLGAELGDKLPFPELEELYLSGVGRFGSLSESDEDGNVGDDVQGIEGDDGQ